MNKWEKGEEERRKEEREGGERKIIIRREKERKKEREWERERELFLGSKEKINKINIIEIKENEKISFP